MDEITKKSIINYKIAFAIAILVIIGLAMFSTFNTYQSVKQEGFNEGVTYLLSNIIDQISKQGYAVVQTNSTHALYLQALVKNPAV